jgi:hypothetical protein
MEEAPTAGFTGHQDIGDVATVEWVRATIRREVALKAVGRGVTSRGMPCRNGKAIHGGRAVPTL